MSFAREILFLIQKRDSFWCISRIFMCRILVYIVSARSCYILYITYKIISLVTNVMKILFPRKHNSHVWVYYTTAVSSDACVKSHNLCANSKQTFACVCVSWILRLEIFIAPILETRWKIKTTKDFQNRSKFFCSSFILYSKFALYVIQMLNEFYDGYTRVD